jgi:hypothetical protein
LDQKFVTIKGFLKKEKHGKGIDLILTETVTDVCFMCDHDEHYCYIQLLPDTKDSKLYTLKDDDYIEVEGLFFIKRDYENKPSFQLKNIQSVNIIKE